jgi:two-component system, NarL family, nitrate/nitrite response regulator NarL
MPRIAIVGSNRLFREALSRMLGECGYQVVAHAIDPGAGAPTGARQEEVDLVLTEMAGPNRSTADWLDRIAAHFPGAKIILLTGNGDSPGALLDALTHGARGYIQKSLSFETVRAVVDAVSHDQMVYPKELRLWLAKVDGHGAPQPGTAATIGPERRPPNGRAVRDPFEDGGRSNSAAPAATQPAPGDDRSTDEPDGGESAPADAELSIRERQILSEVAQGHSNKVIAFRLQLSEATVKSHLKSLLRKLGFSNRTQAAIFALKHPALTSGGMTNGSGSPHENGFDPEAPTGRRPLRR